jgi:hypothetical protein
MVLARFTPVAGIVPGPRPARPQITRQTNHGTGRRDLAYRVADPEQAVPTAGLRPPSMITFRPVVRPARLGQRLSPPARVPADSWGQGHWPDYRATGRVVRATGRVVKAYGRIVKPTDRAGRVNGPLAAPLGGRRGMLHASTQLVCGSGPARRATGPESAVQLPSSGHTPGARPKADWLRPARCPRGRRSRAPLAIRPTEPAQLTAHKRAELHCLPAPRVYGADGDPSTATAGSARPH